jgi:methylmalonyl-CoA mutase C-terminal domain/subunit
VSAGSKVILAKIGLDGHDRGVRVLARALRDAGMEVVYLGPWASIEEVVQAAVQEDAQVVGVSSLAYDHLIVPDLLTQLGAAGWDGRVLVGGVVQAQDLPALEAAGVARVFHPGEPLDEVVAAVGEIAASVEKARA